MKKNRRGNRGLSALAILALVLGLFAAMPGQVHAASGPGDLVDAIEYYSHGGQGALQAHVSGNTVTVTGTVTGAAQPLSLDPDEGIKVVWKAKLWGNSSPLIVLDSSAKGSFEVAAEADINSSNAITLLNNSMKCAILVSGGRILNQAASGIGILASKQGATVKVTGGTVSASGNNGRAIVCDGPSAVVTVTGGYVLATGGGWGTRAIDLSGSADKAAIHVSGGDVYASGDAIAVYAYNATVNVSGGYIRSTGTTNGSGIYLAQTAGTGTVTMTGGKVGALGSQAAHGICLDSDWSLVEISGGTVTSSGAQGGTVWIRSSHAIVLLRGSGRIENTGSGRAILTDNKEAAQVTVQGTSVVSVQSQQAILARLAELSGGFVFGIGPDIGLVDVYGGKPSYTGTVIRCAWNKPAGNPVYEMDTNKDLSVGPGASAYWSIKNGQPGIAYINGNHTGFYPISGITIKAPPQHQTETSTTTTTTTTTSLEPTSWSPPDESSTSPTSPASQPADPTSPPSASDDPAEDQDGPKGGFNWLWLVLIGLVLLAVGGGLAVFLIRRKKAREEEVSPKA